jgi:hypothetical protein
MALTNLDNERGNLLALVNNLKDFQDNLVLPTAQPFIADASVSEEETTPTVAEFDALVGKVNDIIGALTAYGVTEGNPG